MEGHSDCVRSVAFSPDGAHVVSGSVDNTVRIWDATTGAEVTKMEGHSFSVQSVAFSPAGADVVSGSDDRTVRIWDATAGAEVMKMEGHSDSVQSVAFSPDDTHIVSGWVVLRRYPIFVCFGTLLNLKLPFFFLIAFILSLTWVRLVLNFRLVIWALTGNKSITLRVRTTSPGFYLEC